MKRQNPSSQYERHEVTIMNPVVAATQWSIEVSLQKKPFELEYETETIDMVVIRYHNYNTYLEYCLKRKQHTLQSKERNSTAINAFKNPSFAFSSFKKNRLYTWSNKFKYTNG